MNANFLPDLPPAFWLLGILAGVIAGASKTGVPGIGILVAVILPTIFPSREAIGATVPILKIGRAHV